MEGQISEISKILKEKDAKIASLSSNYKKLESFLDTIEKENEQNHLQMEGLVSEIENLREKERTQGKP